jgi:GH15 family glucan-1,4-alpha-glucosidase
MTVSAPPPLDHGAVGNGRIIALVSPTSAVEWLCMPRFDSPSVFARLLDRERGGCLRVLVDGQELRGTLRYRQNTNVLVTRFEVGACEFEIVDFAPWLPRPIGHDAPPELIRLIRPVRGMPRIRVDFDPQPDYARARADLTPLANGIAITGGGQRFHLATNLPIDYILAKRDFALREPIFVSLLYGDRTEAPGLAKVEEELNLTTAAWRIWAKGCALPSYAPDAVLRSALCLKLHAHIETGAVIAAATTSIPEAMNTERTWDYRYCWLRDAAFVVEALRRLSHLREGERFLAFLRDVGEGGPLQPLYSIDGGRDLEEHVIAELAGFGGTGPVRIGNQAAQQRQHDLMGEMLLCMATLIGDRRLVLDDEASLFPLIRRWVEDAIALAPVPDTSIWEFRSILRNYTFSRAMCWVAIDVGAALARRFGEVALADEWQRIADAERAVILERGFSKEHGFFTQALDGKHPDASLLLLPTLGVIDARDPRFVSTLDAYERILAPDGLMKRYINADDFGATHSAFTICTFWWAEALALAGKLDRAVEVFDHVLRFANPLGLFSEDIDPATGALLGNFPQAYTHVGLVNAAATISELIEARDRRFGAWNSARAALRR